MGKHSEGEGLAPEARDDAIFGLYKAEEGLAAVRQRLVASGPGERETMKEAIAVALRQMEDARTTMEQCALVPIVDLYELARIPSVLDEAESDLGACGVSHDTEHFRDGALEHIATAVQLLTSHLPLQGMVDQEPADSVALIRDRAHRAAEGYRQEKAEKERRDEELRQQIVSRVERMLRDWLPHGWLGQLYEAGCYLTLIGHQKSKHETLYGLDNPGSLVGDVVCHLESPNPGGSAVRVKVRRDGGEPGDPELVIELRRKSTPGAPTSIRDVPSLGWRCDKLGEPRDASDEALDQLALFLNNALGLGEV